jgi:hypothetical protein
MTGVGPDGACDDGRHGWPGIGQRASPPAADRRTAERAGPGGRPASRRRPAGRARNLQVQERLTQQVANWLQVNLEPGGVGVVIEAEHLCVSLSGVRAARARTVTSAVHGSIRDDDRTRQEFFALAVASH